MLISVATLLPLGIAAQDVTYSQFYANPLFLNPALTGAEDCPRIHLNYRNQWPSLPGAFASYSASYDQYSEFMHGGLGVQFTYDQSGEAGFQRMKASAIYAYRLFVSDELTAQMGLQAGYSQRSIDAGALIIGYDPNGDPVYASQNNALINQQVSYPDFAGGFMLGWLDKYFIGGAVHHLSQPNISFFGDQDYNLNMRITVHAGANFGGDDGYYRSYGNSLMVSPNLLYQQQGVFKNMNAGSYFTLQPFVAGLWYRHAFENPDAVIASLGFFQENYRIGYSYDYTLSGLSNASGGAHEISFVWIFDCIQKSKRPRAIKCPTF